MGLVDQYRSWRNKRNAMKYISSVRAAVARRLEAGRETRERWDKQFSWYDGTIKRDHLRSKHIMDTLRLIRDINPDASMAIWNFLRLSNRGHEVECIKPTGSPFKQGQTIIDDLAKRVGKLYGGGSDQLINVLNLTGYTQGAIALEVELNEGLNDVVDFHAVDPSTLEWRRNKETGEMELVQKQLDGEYKVLNREQVFYYPIDPDIGDPYGRSPILPVLQIIFFQVEVLRDLKAVAHHQGHARFDISVLEESILKNIPPTITAKGDQAVRDFVMGYIKEIENGFKNLKPDDNFFHTDSVKVEMTGGTNGKSLDPTNIINVINQQVVTALKQLPILLGRNEGTTETHGTVQWQIYVAGIESIQRATKRILERAYNLSLRVHGVNARAKVTFHKLRVNDRQKEATAEQIETQTLISQVNQGWIDNNEAAQKAVGHDAVGDPIQPQNPFSTQMHARAHKTPRARKMKATRADDEEDEYVKGVEASWASDVAKETTKASVAFYAFLQEEKKTIVKNLKSAPDIPTRILVEIQSRADGSGPFKSFIDWVKENILKSSTDRLDQWKDKLYEWMERVAIISGKSTLAELIADMDFDSKDEKLLRWLQERSLREAELIQGETDQDVIMTLWDVVAEGNYTIDKASKALEEAYSFGTSRGKIIARTEMLGAARCGQYNGDFQSGMVIGKTWHSAHDHKTRDAHIKADGQTVRFDEEFTVWGEELLFPGDTSHGATAKNVIQCRCFYTRILEGEEDKLEELMS